MLPGISQKQIQKAMQKMGVKQEKIDAEEVVIKIADGGKIIIKEPDVMKVDMMGQESLQITGQMEYLEDKKEDDIKLIMEQVNCSEKEARDALEKHNGEIAKAILELQKS